MGASLRPSDFKPGGLVDDMKVLLKDLSFVLFDYDGKAKETLAIRVSMGTEDGEEHEQMLSAGDPKFFAPSKDGKEAVPVGTRQELNDNTNAFLFIKSLAEAGFPEDRITDRLDCFEGTWVHINRRPAPKRTGIIQQAGDSNRERTVMEVTRIYSYPWEKGATKKVGAKASAKPQPTRTPTPATAGGDGDVDERVMELVAQACTKGPMSLTKLTQSVYPLIAKEDQRTKAQIIKRTADPELLQMMAAMGTITFENNTVGPV